MGSNVPLLNFNGGEIGQEAMARIDLEVYPTCADMMENCWPLLGGGLIKAPGTLVCDETPSSAVARVLPFIFDVTDSYVLEFSNQAIRFDYGGATVVIEGAAATIGNAVNNSSTGGSSVTPSGVDVTFNGVHEGIAAARWEITTAAPSDEVTLRFVTTIRDLKVQVGTTTTGSEIIEEITLSPGTHILTFTPGAGAYYLQAKLEGAGKATLTGLVRLAAGDLVLPSPYTEAQLAGVKYEQLFDLYWLYHPSHQTRVLERRGSSTWYGWSLRLFFPKDGPFYPTNLDTLNTIVPSANRGTATLTAVKSTFKATDVGRLIQLVQGGQSAGRTIDAVNEATDAIFVEAHNITWSITGSWVGTIVMESSENGQTGWSTEMSWTSTNSASNATVTLGKFYRLRATVWTSGAATVSLTNNSGSSTGRALITAVASAFSATCEIFERFAFLTGTAEWALGMWSDGEGWPVCGVLQDGRHVLVGDQDRFWESVSDDYESILIGSDDADAISRRIGVSRAGVPRWVAAGERALVGTTGAELEVRSSALDEPVTPDTINIRSLNERRGSADVQPVVANKRVCFINRFRNRIYEVYFENGAHAIDDLTWLHKKIGGVGGFVELAYAEEPEPRLLAVRADGQMGVMLYRPTQGVYGWARVVPAGTDAKFESVCVIPGETEDRIYAIVSRTIGGVTKRFREIFGTQEFLDAAEAVRVHCGVVYEGAATDTIGGLAHLEGETVSVWANGRVHPDCVVSSGAITLNYEVEYAIIGLNYVGKWRSAKLAYGATMGTALTQDKKVGRTGLIVLETPVGAVGYGRDFGNIDYKMGEFQDGMIMDAPVTLVTGELNQPFDGATEIDGRLCLVMDKPAPVHVLAVVPNVELHERA